jgi:peptidyl-prolyl cis-trans isomerase SurA
MEVGDISMPTEVQLRDGSRAFHIVLLEKRVPSHVVDLETDYALIEQRALQEKQNRVLQEWMQQLKKDVYIDLRGTSRGLYSSSN